METREIVKKLAELLYKDEGVYDGVVCFDWSSYEYEDDIPHIILDNKLIKIEEFQVNKEGNKIIIYTDDNKYVLNLEMFNENDFKNMGMGSLLIDIYYETDYSWEFGDFEIDFLGI